MATLNVKVKGISPLLLHNGQTADPLNQFSKAIKAISSKKKKTEADYNEMARLEWNAALYVNEQKQLIMPAENIEAALITAAKKQKLGTVAKSALWVLDDCIIDYMGKGPSIEEMEKDESFRFVKAVRIGTSKTMRTRPILKDWSGVFNVEYDNLQIDENTLISVINDCGHMVGFGDWRPRFGRFTAEKI